MCYDLTNPDASYYWLHEALQIKRGDLIESYVIECHNDFNAFYNKYRALIDKLDVENKLMYVGAFCYDVDYEKYTNLDVISRRKEQLHKIGHKIYYDFRINAFLFCEDIYDYSTIHEAPEFLYTLSCLNDTTKGIDTEWKNLYSQPPIQVHSH